MVFTMYKQQQIKLVTTLEEESNSIRVKRSRKI